MSKDSTLQGALWDQSTPLPRLLRASLQTALLSALSKKLLLRPAGLGVQVQVEKAAGAFRGILDRFVKPGDQVCVIGLGGFVGAAMAHPYVSRVFVADYYCNLPHSIERAGLIRERYPGKELVMSDGSHNAEIMKAAQVICITGSSIANETLSSLLQWVSHDSTVILEGISGNLLPTVLFEEGITYVTTPYIEPDFWEKLSPWLNSHAADDLSGLVDFFSEYLSDVVNYSPINT